jgi:hypothetical protein
MIAPSEPVYSHVIVITASVFMGYASLVTLQHRLKEAHDRVPHPPDDLAFEYASQLNYVGNLVFRLAHNFIFACFTPRQRVHISLGCMALAALLLVVPILILESPWLGWVPIAYLMGGVSVGTFESNLLSSLTALGHGTKKWAILGMPLGFTCISVAGFLLMLAGVPLRALYLTVAISCVCSSVVFATTIPDGGPQAYHKPGAGGPSQPPLSHFARFGADLYAWRSWFPQILPHTVALMCNMYTVSFMTAIQYYILNDSKPGGAVALIGADTLVVPHDAYFAVYNTFIYVGDSLSRQLVYRAEKLRHPFLYLICSAVGGLLCLAKLPLLTPVGIFLVFFANGSIYATSTKHIDTNVDRARNLTALSIWLFIGDVGAVLGSNTWELVAPLVCDGVHSPHMCLR